MFAGIGKTYQGFTVTGRDRRKVDLQWQTGDRGEAPRRERGSINPDDIITGAFELAEQVSIDNLSMPLLGKHLGWASRASTGASARRTTCSTR